jgi:hypothetical protein
MLAVVSAVVAFDRGPGASVQGPAQTLVLSDKAPAIRVSATARSATPASRAAGTRGSTRGTVPHRTLNGGGVAGERFTGGRPGAGSPSTVTPAIPPVVPKTPEIPSPDNILNPISNPDTTTSQIADGAQSVTDTAGRSLTDLNPDVGSTVTETGQAVAQTVRSVPLPDHVIPGH